jgi:integrase
MQIPDFKLIGDPQRYVDGRGNKAANYLQRFRLLNEPRRTRKVSLQTTDLTTARRRAVRFVEDKLRAELIANDPQARTANRAIGTVLQEYLDHLRDVGNSAGQVKMVKTRCTAVITEAKYKEFSHVDSVTAIAAIGRLAKRDKFGVTTQNKYREALRSWSRFMYLHSRWPVDVLALMPKFKGDTTIKRPRTILTDREFDLLLESTMKSKPRRRLTGEQRVYLYITCAATGIRAHEASSLTPASFDFRSDPPTLTVHCTISKRRKQDVIVLNRDYAAMMKEWMADKPKDEKLWGNTAWYSKAAVFLAADLDEAKIARERNGAKLDFHSFRAQAVTKALMTGASSRTVMASVRLSSESLLTRYQKLPQSEIVNLVNNTPVPRLPLRIVG